jgi:hypothetical protein
LQKPFRPKSGAFFTASAAGSLLIVSAVASGSNPIAPGQVLAGAGHWIADKNSQSASGTPGGAGIYNLSAPLAVSSQSMTGKSSIGATTIH